MSKPLKKYLNEVADLGCILCLHLGYGPTPAQLHHPRNAAGGGERASDWLVIPLCPEHHTGNSGLHGLGGSGFYTRYKLTEWNLVALTIEHHHKSKN
jgi:hypothetical protein